MTQIFRLSHNKKLVHDNARGQTWEIGGCGLEINCLLIVNHRVWDIEGDCGR